MDGVEYGLASSASCLWDPGRVPWTQGDVFPVSGRPCSASGAQVTSCLVFLVSPNVDGSGGEHKRVMHSGPVWST